MKEIVEKLSRVIEKITLEKTSGILRFFGLIERNDLENKWDILLSADWLEKNNSEKDLIYVIERLKEEFSNNLDFLSSVVLLIPSNPLIKYLAKAVSLSENEGIERHSVKIDEDFTIKHMYVLASDFTGFDLTDLPKTSVVDEQTNITPSF